MARLKGLLAETIEEDTTELVFERNDENRLLVTAPRWYGSKQYECNILDQLAVGNDQVSLSARGLHGRVSVHFSLTPEAAQLLSEGIRRERVLIMHLNHASWQAESILSETRSK